MTERMGQEHGDQGVAVWAPMVQSALGAWYEIIGARSKALSNSVQRMRDETYGADQLVQDWASFWIDWLDDSIRLLYAVQRPLEGDSVPEIVFVLDDTATAADPKEVSLRVSVDELTEAELTEFREVGGSSSAVPFVVHAKLFRRQRRLRVSISNIGKNWMGHWLGFIYVPGPGSRPPLAVIHVINRGPD